MTPTNRWRWSALVVAISLPLSAAPKKPLWISGPDPKYPETKFLIGVGIGTDLDGARSNARAEIARTFQARVQQTLTDQQSESSTSSGNRRSAPLGSQQSQITTQLTTDALLEGVSIAETYNEKKSKKTFALAVLDKIALRRTLGSRILEKEQEISAAKIRANAAASPLERARALSSALASARDRDNLSARRRVVDPSPLSAELQGQAAPHRGDGPAALSAELQGQAAPHRGDGPAALSAELQGQAAPHRGDGPAGMADFVSGTGELETALYKTIADIPVSVTAEGPEGSALGAAVAAQINGLGVPVSAKGTTGLSLKATLQVAPFDRGVPQWSFFQWTGVIELTDLATGKIIASSTKDGVEGHLTPITAKSKTIAAGETALGLEAARLINATLFGQ